jgi:SAM-dependent methyltransferase
VYPEALSYLRCPHHPAHALTLAADAVQGADGAICGGTLTCVGCAARYPIRDGIADLLPGLGLPPTLAQLTNALPVAAWAYERSWRPRALTLLTGEPFGYERELPLVVGLADVPRGGLIVDVACSNGLYARALERARNGLPGHVIGIDHSLPMLKQARAFAQSEGVQISFVRARAQALPFAPAAAATLVMGGSLNEIGDSGKALDELRRTLAPDGHCVLMSLVAGSTTAGRTLQAGLGLGGVEFPPLTELNRRLAIAGLRLRAQWRYRVVVFSLLMRS